MIDRKTLISVIVPVYKVEPYLRCCIDSILAQTFRNFELILVDDGSPDNCGAICEEYAEKDDRVVVIHQENRGVSAARNTALDWVFANSDSQWITFVDSDDYIPEGYLKQLHKYMIQENADIVTTFAYDVSDDNVKVQCHDVNYQIYTGREVCKSFFQIHELAGITAWGKLVRRDLLRTLRFPEGRVHEDQEWVPKLFYTAGKIVALSGWWYCYRNRPESIVHSGDSIKLFDSVAAQDNILSFFTEHHDEEMTRLAEHKKQRLWGEYTVRVWYAKQYADIPAEYRLPVWKACLIFMAESIRYGGIRYIHLRGSSLFRKLLSLIRSKVVA